MVSDRDGRIMELQKKVSCLEETVSDRDRQDNENLKQLKIEFEKLASDFQQMREEQQNITMTPGHKGEEGIWTKGF